jgi:hypothetical protein
MEQWKKMICHGDARRKSVCSASVMHAWEQRNRTSKAELPLDKDCLTLELEDLHLIDFRNEGLGTEDSVEAKLVLEGE